MSDGSMRYRTVQGSGRAVLITICTLLVFRLAHFVPIPGLDLDALFYATGNNERFSIMALGAYPWLNAVILAELAALLFPAAWTSFFTKDGHADPYSKPIVLVALAFAFSQSIGIVSVFNAIDMKGADSRLLLDILQGATLIGGTVLAIAIALMVERHGIGLGLWLLLLVAVLTEFIANSAQDTLSVMSGQLVFGRVMMVNLLCLLVCAIAVLLLMVRQRSGYHDLGPLVWPQLIAATVLAPFISLVVMISGPVWFDANSYWIQLIATIIALVAVCALYFRKERHALFALAITAFHVVAFAAQEGLLLMWGAYPAMNFGNAIITATILYSVLSRLTVQAPRYDKLALTTRKKSD
ncbi:MAG: hypothetical protein ACRCU5_02095 [Rhizobiaceae bacterium]